MPASRPSSRATPCSRPRSSSGAYAQAVARSLSLRSGYSKFGQAAGRSKGFGFVELGSEDEQKRAVEQFHGKEVETAEGKRELSVKVAINAAPQEAAEGEAAPAAAEKTAAQ
jgi:hypothetical protein